MSRSGRKEAGRDADLQLAEAVRRACLESALAAWEDAGLSGLCGEGRWEAAVGAIRRLDVSGIVNPHA